MAVKNCPTAPYKRYLFVKNLIFFIIVIFADIGYISEKKIVFYRTAGGVKDTGVETTYGKAQRGTPTCQMDRRPRQDCRESLDAGGIGPVTLEIN